MNHALFTALNFSVIASSSSPAVLPIKRSTDVVITAGTAVYSLETEQVLELSRSLLGGSVDLSEDGIGRATHHLGGFETALELRGLMVREIVSAPLTEQERAAGISRRYLAHVSYKSHRVWDGPMGTWTEWREMGYGFFPSEVVVEEIDGALTARANRIADFVPGIESGLILPS